MAVLKDFPVISQLTTITEDGLPNTDAQFECVATSILAGVMWLLGVKQLGGKFTPDYFKDQVYGEAYQGGTDAARYVYLCKSFGVKLYSADGNPSELISQAHTNIGEARPVIFTELDPYVPASYGWTHVCVWFADAPGQLTALDPYIGRPLTKSDDEWLQVLSGHQIWLVEKIQEEAKGIPAGWKDNGTELLAPNNVAVVRGFRDYVLAHNWKPENVPLEIEHGAKLLEGSNPSLGAGTQQIFNEAMLEYTPTRGVFEAYIGKELIYTREQVVKYYDLAMQLRDQLVKVIGNK